MRSLVKWGKNASDTSILDREIPKVQAGGVLMRVEACGLCGSDIHAWRSDIGYEWVAMPLILGHEIVGTLVDIGADVSNWKVGDRAVVVSIQGCLNCSECLEGRTQRCLKRKVIGLSYDGGMSQYVEVSSAYLVPVPLSIKSEIGAAIEPLSVAAHATLTMGRVVSGQKVVVSGAGFVGIACALLAKDAGADVVLIGAPRDATFRLPAASDIGLATRTIDQGGWGSPDVWIEASGAPSALAAAVSDIRMGGLISVVGLYTQAPIADVNLLVRREIEVRGSYASVASEYSLVIELLAAGRLHIESLLEVFDLEAGLDAFITAAESRTIKPILIPKGS
jgi:L-iditol 2-dehydrogenase